MRTIRIRVVIDIRIGIIQGAGGRVVTPVAGGRVTAAAAPVIPMVVLVILAMVMVVPVIPAGMQGSQVVEPVVTLVRLVITKRGAV